MPGNLPGRSLSKPSIILIPYDDIHTPGSRSQKRAERIHQYIVQFCVADCKQELHCFHANAHKHTCQHCEQHLAPDLIGQYVWQCQSERRKQKDIHECRAQIIRLRKAFDQRAERYQHHLAALRPADDRQVHDHRERDHHANNTKTLERKRTAVLLPPVTAAVRTDRSDR